MQGRQRAEFLRKVAAEAVEKRDSKVHKVLSLESDGTHKHWMLTACEINTMVSSGKLNAQQVVHNLSLRCAKYGRGESVNAITEEFYDEAYEAANTVDKSSSEKPLCGVPVSVKDCLGKKGALQTGGMSCRAQEEHRSTEDSVLVRQLQEGGALVLVRGNVPQSMMMPDSENNIFGQTRNPWNLSRTPGGSSGGDGALVAMRCVPLAIGTDVGGSVRIPAAFCGVTGFKPTPHRISKRGCMVPRKDNVAASSLTIPSVVGPIARTVEDCAQMLRTIWREQNFDMDHTVPPIAFNEKAYSEKGPLKIGYFKSDGWFEPCSAAVRCMDEVIQKLQAAGHTVVPFELPATGWETYPLYVSIMSADGNMRSFVEGLEGEPLHEMYSKLKMASDIPNLLRPMAAMFLDKRRATLVRSAQSGGISAYEYWQKCGELMKLRKKWLEAFEDAGVDAVIHPTLPLPALPLRACADITAAFSYTFIANLMLWPAGAVPCTLVRKDEETYPLDKLPEDQRDHWAKMAQNVMSESAGLPMSVEVMAPPFKDEKCLNVMKVIQDLVNFTEEPKAFLDA